MMLMQRSQVHKCFIKSKTEVYIQRKVGWSDQRTVSRILKGRSIQLENRIKNKKGRSTSSEVLNILAPKGACHLRMKILGMIFLLSQKAAQLS
jgi:hypothetical protein